MSYQCPRCGSQAGERRRLLRGLRAAAQGSAGRTVTCPPRLAHPPAAPASGEEGSRAGGASRDAKCGILGRRLHRSGVAAPVLAEATNPGRLPRRTRTRRRHWGMDCDEQDANRSSCHAACGGANRCAAAAGRGRTASSGRRAGSDPEGRASRRYGSLQTSLPRSAIHRGGIRSVQGLDSDRAQRAVDLGRATSPPQVPEGPGVQEDRRLHCRSARHRPLRSGLPPGQLLRSHAEGPDPSCLQA